MLHQVFQFFHITQTRLGLLLRVLHLLLLRDLLCAALLQLITLPAHRVAGLALLRQSFDQTLLFLQPRLVVFGKALAQLLIVLLCGCELLFCFG